MAGFRNGRKRDYDYDSKSNLDEPPNSRLFVICSKQLTEEDFRDSFSRFGDIEDLWVVKDRTTGDPKGVVYIKYAKTSEAAAALEAMNGKVIGNGTRQLKVTIAASRDQGSKRDGNEEEKMLRLFVVVPKTMTNEDLHEAFKVYGDIDYAAVIKDKEKHESKGFAYIKYHKFSHAAAAFEQCDRKYRAVFAEPRKPRQPETHDNMYSSNYRHEPPRGGTFPSIALPDVDDGFSNLQVIASPMLNQDQIWKLFDLIPGMDYCQSRLEGNPRPDRLVSLVVYNSPRAASYALEKLHGFEYPIGSRLIVKPDYSSRSLPEPRGMDRSRDRPAEREIDRNRDRPVEREMDRTRDRPIEREMDRTRDRPIERERDPPNRQEHRNVDLMHLADTIAQATSIMQAAGFSPSDFLSSNKFGGPKKLQCSVKLPDPKPVLDSDTEMEARCFVICTQQALPTSVLRDAFCRFGSLIDVYLLPNRNCGYAKFASRESAENAIKTLHGAEVEGVRLKVIEAEEPGIRKRMRLEENN